MTFQCVLSLLLVARIQRFLGGSTIANNLSKERCKSGCWTATKDQQNLHTLLLWTLGSFCIQATRKSRGHASSSAVRACCHWLLLALAKTTPRLAETPPGELAKWKIIQPCHEVLYIMSIFVPKLARFTKFFLSTWICLLSLDWICILAFQFLPFILILSFIIYKWIHFLNWITFQFLPWNCWKFLQTASNRRLKNPACPILSHLQLLSILPSLWDRNISGRSCGGDAMANPQKFHAAIFSESVARLWPHLKFWKQGI